MELDKLYRFINMMNGFEWEVKLELPNYPVPFKLAKISKEQLDKAMAFYRNQDSTIPESIWQPYEMIGSNAKLDKYYLTIFEPGFENVRAQIVSDRFGGIWIHETCSNSPHDNRQIADDIESFLSDFALAFSSQTTIDQILGKKLYNKISLEEKFHDVSNVMSIIVKAINESSLKSETHYQVKSSLNNNGYYVHDVELNIGELKLDTVFNSKNSWLMLSDINTKLAEQSLEYRFAFLHEYNWDAIHIVAFLSNEEYNLLQKKNFVVSQMLK